MEPERHIEKLLRAVAKKRREQSGEPFELHPAARQELLREAAQRTAKKSGGGFFAQIFSAFGPRLALALSVAVIVAVGAWLVRPLLRETTAVSTPGALSLRADRAVPNNQPLTEPAPESAAPTVITTGPVSDADGDTATASGVARRSSVQGATKDEVRKQPASPAFKSALSNKPVANHRESVAAASPTIRGAAQPEIAQNEVSVSTGTAATPPALSTPAGTQEKTREADSFAAGNRADQKSSSTSVAIATNGIASSTTFAAANRDAQKKLKQGTLQPGAMNTDQAATFDSVANNQATGKLTSNAQRFNRVITVPTTLQRGFGGGSPVTPLLASFRMEQNGQEIRVIDADGSVYTGSWQVTPQEIAPPAAAPAPAHAGGLHFFGTQPAASSASVAPALDKNSQALLNYSFTVSGTNRNLKQKITFTGKFIALTNTFNAANNAGPIGGLEGQVAAPLNATPPALLNSRIAGKVVIGEKREIEVNANPAP